MASSIQLLRSTIAQERPFPGNLLEGQPAININSSEPGLFFKATDGSLVKVGPAAVTSDGSPPNSSPGGLAGNTVGEMWLDKSINPPILKVYDGSSWINAGSGGGGGGGAGSFVRWIYAAIGGETSLSGSSGGVLLEYVPGLEEVFVNGVLITRGQDYSAVNGTSITNLVPLTAGDVVTVLSVIPLETVQLPGQASLLRWTILATTGQTQLTGSDSAGEVLSYTSGLEQVFVNGALLRRGVDYTATDGVNINLNEALSEDDEVTVLAFSPFTVGSLSITDADVAPGANIAQSKLDLSITDSEVSATAAIDSEKISYLDPLSNTVARTAEARFSDYVSVLDFIPVSLHAGIKDGTNTTDLSTYISNAINAADRRHVFFPQGTYLVKDTLDITILSFSLIGERVDRGQNTQYYRSGKYGATRIEFNPDDKNKFLINKFQATPNTINIIGPFEIKNLTFRIFGANGIQFGNEALGVEDGPAANGQAYVHAAQISGCNFEWYGTWGYGSQPDGTLSGLTYKRHIGFCKSFESMVYNCSFRGGGYAIRGFGCDKLNVTSCRAFTLFPLNFVPKGTFTVQHTVHDFQTEGWLVSPVNNEGVCLDVSNSRFEQNTTGLGTGRFLLPSCTATVTANSDVVAFSRSMTNILIPGWSLIELNDGSGNVDTCLVKSLSSDGLSVTVASQGFRFTWSGTATVTRIHGFGPMNNEGSFENSYVNISPGARDDTPAFVYVCSRASMYLTNVFGEFGAYGNIQVLAVGNRMPGQFDTSGQLSMVNCSQLLCPTVPHPAIRVQNWGMQPGEMSKGNQKGYGADSFDSLNIIYRRWIYTPARYQTVANDNQLTTWKYVQVDPDTTQRVWAWLLDQNTGSSSRTLWIYDNSLPSLTYGNINFLVRARAVSGTASLSLVVGSSAGGSTLTTFSLTTSWQTFKFTAPKPALWNSPNTNRLMYLNSNADSYISAIVVEDTDF